MTEEHRRTCTMPWLPFGLRDKFTVLFNDLCKQHDDDYAARKCKLCADYRFALAIAKRGYWYLFIPVFLAVNLPIVWYRYVKNTGS